MSCYWYSVLSLSFSFAQSFRFCSAIQDVKDIGYCKRWSFSVFLGVTDEVVSGLDRMTTSVLFPNVVYILWMSSLERPLWVLFRAIDLLIAPVLLALNNLSLNVKRSSWHWSRWSMFLTVWETLVTLEFSTISFPKRLSDYSKMIFLSALASSNASWASNCFVE